MDKTTSGPVTEEYNNQTAPGLEVQIRVQREPSTMETGVIVPGVAISFLSLLYVLIKRDDNSRVGYLTTILLTQVMFLTMITRFVPTARANPAFQELFLSLAMIIFACIFISVIIGWLSMINKDGNFKARARKKYGENWQSKVTVRNFVPENEELEDEQADADLEGQAWYYRCLTKNSIRFFDWVLYVMILIAYIVTVSVQVSEIIKYKNQT